MPIGVLFPADDDETLSLKHPRLRQNDMSEIDVPLVQRLVSAQFPHWAHLPIRPVATSGWDNRTFRLGDHMSVRLPSAERYVSQVEREQRWLPVLAPELPLPIPVPLAKGSPSPTYPHPWSIYRWIPGQRADEGHISNLAEFAADLAEFLRSLWAVDARNGPPAGQDTFYRGGNLAVYDAEARQAMTELAGEIDVPLLTGLWDRALASRWSGRPVWLHGDIAAGNLLVGGGKLAAVIDFGNCCVGDPACDLVIAWTLFDEPARQVFRRKLGMDKQTWDRAAGWCLWKALITIAGSKGRDDGIADQHRRWIAEILADDWAST